MTSGRVTRTGEEHVCLRGPSRAFSIHARPSIGWGNDFGAGVEVERRPDANSEARIMHSR
jgi:hypothetical protein